jgi:hypothetical protein
MGDEDYKMNKSDKERVGLLRKYISSYAQWSEKIQRVVGGDPKFYDVIAWAIDGNNAIYTAMQPLTGNSVEVR